MGLLGRGDRGLRGVHALDRLIIVAAELERHQRRAAVGGDLVGVAGLERRLELGDVWNRSEPGLDVANRGLEVRRRTC